MRCYISPRQRLRRSSLGTDTHFMANKDDRVTQNLLPCQFLFASHSVGLLLVNITADSVPMLKRVCTTRCERRWLLCKCTSWSPLAAANEASACRCLWRHHIIPSIYALNGCARSRSSITKRTSGSCKSLLLLGLREDAVIHRQFKETKAA